MALMVGTSGWQYNDWAGAFYPEGLPKSRWLEYYASRFSTVEANTVFYGLPRRELLESWVARTTDDFVMSVKASRYLTHVRRLKEPKEPVRKLVEALEGLGSKLGPILLQLPPNQRFDPMLLSAALSEFPKEVKVAVEVRHPSWLVDGLRRVLEEHGSAFCLTDRRNRRSPLWRTASGICPIPRRIRLAEPQLRTDGARQLGAPYRLFMVEGRGRVLLLQQRRRCMRSRDAARFASAARRHGLTTSRSPLTVPVRVMVLLAN